MSHSAAAPQPERYRRGRTGVPSRVRRAAEAGGLLHPSDDKSEGAAARRWRGPGGAPSDEVQARVRRAFDAIEAIAGLVVVGIVLLGCHYLPVGAEELTKQVVNLASHLPRVFVFVCAVVAALATVALLVAITGTLIRRRPRDGVNAIVSGAAAALIAIGLVTAWHAFPGGISDAMLHDTDGSTFARDAILVALVTGSDTVRYTGWGRYCIGTLTALVLTGVALNELTLLGAVVAVVGGMSVGAFVRWALRTTVRRPSTQSLVSGLRRAGVNVTSLERAVPEARELTGHLSDGRPIVLKVAGREVHGVGVARRIWSLLRLRGAAIGPQPISMRSALETEALASLMASNTGVVAPRVLLLAHFEPDTLVLARERFDGPALDASATLDQVEELFRSLRRLHEIGVAHRDLRRQNLVCEVGEDVEGGRVGFRSLESAVVGAGELVRRLDLAQLLTSVALLIGAERAVGAMRAGYEPADEAAVAAVLQPVALTSWGWTDMRQARSCLSDVRRELIGEGSAGIAETRLERFRWRTVAAVIALLVAAFLLVGQLSKVNLIGALRSANWTWFLVAILGSALTYLGSSLNLVAFVPQRVSIIKGALVELSAAFLGLVTPPTVGHVAINGRFLHKQGVDPATTASAVALSQLVNFITTLALLVVAALLTGTGVGRLKIVPGPRLLAVLGALVVVGAVLITVVPWTKDLFWNKVWPRIKGTWPQLLDVMSQPIRLAEGIGGNLLLTGSYILALIASLHAVGAQVPIIATAAVFMAGNTIGAAAPTPGGLGAVETVMAAGLTAVGIPAHEAVPGVLLFRLATFWLPILPGWVTFLILQRREIL